MNFNIVELQNIQIYAYNSLKNCNNLKRFKYLDKGLLYVFKLSEASKFSLKTF